MSEFKSDFLRTLSERGLIYQISNPQELDDLFCKTIVTAYIGYDLTALSLHAGHLTQLMILHWLQKTGHRPISLMGGTTSMIGDPSFKNDSRVMLGSEEIKKNTLAIKDIFSRFLKYGNGPTDALMVNNSDWLSEIKYIDLLRDIGSHISVNRMLSFDSVALRLKREQSLSFLEFNYMILQAYDFVELAKNYNCRLQVGGSDQWCNIISGIDLGARLEMEKLFALTSPLLTTSSGTKMGKTEKGAIWLNSKMTTVYDFWQYWRNVEDNDVVRFLKIVTTLPMSEIDKISKLKGKEINEAKKILATEITAIVHGRSAAEQVAATATEVFDMGINSHNMPKLSISKNELEKTIGILNVIVRAGFASSNTEARRHIRSNAIKINNEVISDENMNIGMKDCNDDGIFKLSLGKKRHIIFYICN
ncbi:tyrosine--tRNA ligase [Candidatus Liberibacter americanus]|uniref:Tyrosine--tRNA ligase n=1 Tax=Candidatus Liberibacter americanus str. Sao Paulo TaxID=1261131 RepID=U6B5M3_9HYPH|nr:tyrosine--tRNA ligase [Candidatus Liberibacter americanus]AHA28108.1 Tyrosyl-tRNA synthetase [Candidatus Liberibacter americanus str. Sao Paulo]EMS36045.1 tyrosyl-tRNA synthetase [Candidatus Liberibacter americanus PW_SP]